MTNLAAPPAFAKFKVRPVINACGIYTDLGGSVPSPAVWHAMEEINRSFVRMVELLDRSGEMIASMLGAEAARVVPGASAAITLGTAACIAGRDGNAWEQLPDTSGLKNQVIILEGASLQVRSHGAHRGRTVGRDRVRKGNHSGGTGASLHSANRDGGLPRAPGKQGGHAVAAGTECVSAQSWCSRPPSMPPT